MSIEEAPIRCRFFKDIIEVDKAGERYIITVFSGGVKEYEHWKCYQQQRCLQEYFKISLLIIISNHLIIFTILFLLYEKWRINGQPPS